MDSKAVRQSFLDFFGARDHQQVASAPLVPQGDPTLMFTNAGMVQFKDLFLGTEEPKFPRAVSSQKCLRVSGKHNDLENVGPSPRHHTFFEMLGNFSFGDYFKAEAIEAAWELVTGPWGISPDRLFATVFEEDDEAEELWSKLSTLPAKRILRCGAADNFWAMGETGPCGPCSEIFVDREPEATAVPWEQGCDSGRYLEIWNLVFMQFDRGADGLLTPLPNPSIDTGAGLERVTAVLQGKSSNYETDLFEPIMSAGAELAGIAADGRGVNATVSLRVISDHLRAIAFLLADGIVPGPEGRGYVLRRLLRRAVRHGMRLGFDQPFLYRLVPVVDSVMGEHYRELAETCAATSTTIEGEEEKYFTTRAMGAKRIQDAIDKAREAGEASLSGETLFRLYDTYGQELEVVREIAEEEQLDLDISGFEEELSARRSISRSVTSDLQRRLQGFREALGDPGRVEFVGYDPTPIDASVLRLAVSADGSAQPVRSLSAGEVGVVVLSRTTFYPQGGGQVGDVGAIRWTGGAAKVVDTQKDTAGLITHFVEIEEGSNLEEGRDIRVEVDSSKRAATERNHTATHLLHAALREVLGPRVRQAGSLVAPERLRFDFTHNQPMSSEQVMEVEDLVNRWIRLAEATSIGQSDYRTALASGAMALFGEKYGDTVRTVEVPGVSLELCGGCHVANTGEIGLFLIVGERGVASGVRRIEAVTGTSALELVRTERERMNSIEGELGSVAERAPVEIRALKERVRALERELSAARARILEDTDVAEEIAGIKWIAKEIEGAAAGDLRALADKMRDKLGNGVVVLACRDEEKVGLVVTVSQGLTSRLNAGDLIKSLASKVGGGGGGRADFAQAGGRNPAQLPAMLESVPRLISSVLSPD